MLSVTKSLIALGWLSITGLTIALGQTRLWQDPSGRYQVEGTLVASDATMVVLKNTAGELVVLKKEQLSTADQKFLKSQAGASSAKLEEQGSDASKLPTVKQPAGDQPPPDAENDSETAGDQQKPTEADRLEQLRNEISTWHLRNGKSVKGLLLGFGQQDFVILRREGDLWINGLNSKTLPAAYELIVPAVVADIDGQPLGNFAELEKHIAAGGAGPFEYVVAGVQLELDDGGVITVPLALLEPALAEQLEPGFARWQAAQESGVTEEDRYATSRRERLILASLARLRQMEAAQERNMKLVELNLLSVNAGLTEIWEVLLVPAYSYGFPHSVIVPGRDSFDAQQIAAQAYPGWQVGPVRKLSY